MNGDSELLHNVRGPTGLAYIDVAFFEGKWDSTEWVIYISDNP